MTKGQKPAPLPFEDERSGARNVASLPATISELQARPTAVQVIDLSAKGCRLSGSDLPARAEVWVTIDGYVPIRATVIWQKRGELGCEFYGTPVKVRSASGAPRPACAPAGPHPLRARLREKSIDD